LQRVNGTLISSDYEIWLSQIKEMIYERG